MAETWCGVLSEGKASTPEPSSRAARRRRIEIRQFKFVASGTQQDIENRQKRQKLELHKAASPRERDNAVENSASDVLGSENEVAAGSKHVVVPDQRAAPLASILSPPSTNLVCPKFGIASVCGRRRDMEDAVAIHPSFCRSELETASLMHFFGVYDGHGCSHVAMKCRDRLHELVEDELKSKEASSEWKDVMERSFNRMDKEVISWNESVMRANCRCELRTPECDAVGSTAVVAVVTPHKIIVANCGDSRAVLCRNGKPVLLSNDHKPDRPDELNRIHAAGGRVIYWEGARVLGVLAMSRAIGDNYLKPYVICEPEVTVTDRTAEDECLILASDGLWDVVSNNTACGVARMCLRGKAPPCAVAGSPGNEAGGENADKACSEASTLLTKLALARRSADNVSVVVVDLRRDT
ncbi:Phosphoprotein phosphatase [Bertholletia excelsa]